MRAYIPSPLSHEYISTDTFWPVQGERETKTADDTVEVRRGALLDSIRADSPKGYSSSESDTESSSSSGSGQRERKPVMDASGKKRTFQSNQISKKYLSKSTSKTTSQTSAATPPPQPAAPSFSKLKTNLSGKIEQKVASINQTASATAAASPVWKTLDTSNNVSSTNANGSILAPPSASNGPLRSPSRGLTDDELRKSGISMVQSAPSPSQKFKNGGTHKLSWAEMDEEDDMIDTLSWCSKYSDDYKTEKAEKTEKTQRAAAATKPTPVEEKKHITSPDPVTAVQAAAEDKAAPASTSVKEHTILPPTLPTAPQPVEKPTSATEAIVEPTPVAKPESATASSNNAARPVASNDFGRRPDTDRAQRLYNSQSGRYEPVHNDTRRLPNQNEAVNVPASVLQRTKPEKSEVDKWTQFEASRAHAINRLPAPTSTSVKDNIWGGAAGRSSLGNGVFSVKPNAAHAPIGTPRAKPDLGAISAAFRKTFADTPSSDKITGSHIDVASDSFRNVQTHESMDMITETKPAEAKSQRDVENTVVQRIPDEWTSNKAAADSILPPAKTSGKTTSPNLDIGTAPYRQVQPSKGAHKVGELRSIEAKSWRNLEQPPAYSKPEVWPSNKPGADSALQPKAFELKQPEVTKPAIKKPVSTSNSAIEAVTAAFNALQQVRADSKAEQQAETERRGFAEEKQKPWLDGSHSAVYGNSDDWIKGQPSAEPVLPAVLPPVLPAVLPPIAPPTAAPSVRTSSRFFGVQDRIALAGPAPVPQIIPAAPEQHRLTPSGHFQCPMTGEKFGVFVRLPPPGPPRPLVRLPPSGKATAAKAAMKCASPLPVETMSKPVFQLSFDRAAAPVAVPSAGPIVPAKSIDPAQAKRQIPADAVRASAPTLAPGDWQAKFHQLLHATDPVRPNVASSKPWVKAAPNVSVGESVNLPNAANGSQGTTHAATSHQPVRSSTSPTVSLPGQIDRSNSMPFFSRSKPDETQLLDERLLGDRPIVNMPAHNVEKRDILVPGPIAKTSCAAEIHWSFWATALAFAFESASRNIIINLQSLRAKVPLGRSTTPFWQQEPAPTYSRSSAPTATGVKPATTTTKSANASAAPSESSRSERPTERNVRGNGRADFRPSRSNWKKAARW